MRRVCLAVFVASGVPSRFNSFISCDMSRPELLQFDVAQLGDEALHGECGSLMRAGR